MGLADSITSAQTLVLDTNILIDAFNNPRGNSGQLLLKIKQIYPKVFISTLVFEEFLVKIYKKKLQKDLAIYEDFITAGGMFIVVNVDRQIARKAAQIRAAYPTVRAPDAIHLATAVESKAKIFATCERRLPKRIEKVRVITVS